MSDDQCQRVAEELRRIREAVRDRPLSERSAADVLPTPLPPRTPRAVPPLPPTGDPPLVERPDGRAVNALWDVRQTPLPGGLRGWLTRALRRALAPLIEAQTTFNSRQVQLDNALLEYIDARWEATHRHYDGVLGIHGRHMEDIDQRHLILQEELVAHVHDLVKRIDLVLSETERGRLSLEVALKELRTRLSQLEQRLARG